MSGGCSRATPVPTGAISKRSKALTTRPAARLGRNIRQAYARARFEKDGEVETFHPVARARREGSRPLNRSALDRDVVRKCRKRPFTTHADRRQRSLWSARCSAAEAGGQGSPGSPGRAMR